MVIILDNTFDIDDQSAYLFHMVLWIRSNHNPHIHPYPHPHFLAAGSSPPKAAAPKPTEASGVGQQ